MEFNKRLRAKIVIAVTYFLLWLFTNGFYARNGPWWEGNIDFYSPTWSWLIVPIALLFSTNIWRWIKAGSDD
jgi:hypothetical protein